MPEIEETILREAVSKFVGHGSVVGVGLAEETSHKIVFLLSDNVEHTKLSIQKWAKSRCVEVCFDVVGNNSPLSRENSER
jgi:hypothetical protein